MHLNAAVRGVVVGLLITLSLAAQDRPRRVWPNLDHRLETALLAGERGPFRVVVTTAAEESAAARVAAAGGSLLADRGAWAGGVVDAAGLARLAHDARALFVRPPTPALPTSSGVPLTGAPALHALGHTGQGTKVCVIDPEFGSFSSYVASGYLPTNVTTIAFGSAAFEAPGHHGTSCLKIVHEMAPGAQLFAARITDDIDLVSATAWAITQGASITSGSFAMTNGNYWGSAGDATVQTVQAEAAAGVLPVYAAGNQAGSHQDGLFADADQDGNMDWPGIGNSLPVNVSGFSYFELSWDAWPTTAIDYDLELLDANGTVIGSSNNVQSGTQPPYETLIHNGGAVPGARLRVKLVNLPAGETHRRVQLHVWVNASYPGGVAKRAGSIVLPGLVPEALAVGAVHVWDWPNGASASYSSWGPSPMDPSLAKPEIVAPSAVDDPLYGTFAGTSAACPHAAGAAALFLEMQPALAGIPGALKSFMEAYALAGGLSTANAPFEYGLGRLTCPVQFQSGYSGWCMLAPQAPAPGGALVVTAGGGLPGAPVTVVADLAPTAPVLFGLAAAHVDLGNCIVLADGLGAFGAPDASALDATGRWNFAFTRPTPALGIHGLRVQAGWLSGGNVVVTTPLVTDL